MMPGRWAWTFVVFRRNPKLSRSLAKTSPRTGSSPGSSISLTLGTARFYPLSTSSRNLLARAVACWVSSAASMSWLMVREPSCARRSPPPERRLDLRQRAQEHVADDLEAPRGELVQRIFRSVPEAAPVGGAAVGVVDQERRRDAGLEQRHLVVLDGDRLVEKMTPVPEPPRRVPQKFVQPGGRAGVPTDVEVAVADHVEDHRRPHAPELPCPRELFDQVAGAVQSGPVEQGMAVLLAVEEGDPDRVLPPGAGQAAGQLQEQGGARSPVVGADEAQVGIVLRIVVPAEQDHLRPPARNFGDEVGHTDGPQGRGRDERLGPGPGAA